jgi:hypothetical protein
MRFAPPFESAATVDAAPYASFWEIDFSTQFIFFQEYQYHAARAGRFPTWNPHIYLGQPFHADGQSAMLHPFDWIYFLVDPDSARGWVALFRLWLSAVGLFCLLRKLELSPSAAFTGGALWVFGSFNMHWLAWPQTNASLWMPLVILAVDYLIIRPSVRMTAVASLIASPLFLSGHPGTEYIAGQIIGFYILCRLISLWRSGVPLGGIGLRISCVGIAVVVGLLIAAAALLPLWMQIRQSYEYLDPTGARGKMEPMAIPVLWLFLLPEHFGRSRGGFPNVNYAGPENYIEMSLWFGAIGLGLALTTMLSLVLPGMFTSRRVRRERLNFLTAFAVSTFILSLLVVFCIEPVYGIASSLPGASLTSLRRLLMASNFSGALLAAVCIHHIFTRKDRAVTALAGLVCLALSALACRELLVHWQLHQHQLAEGMAALFKRFGRSAARVTGAMKIQSPVYRMRAGVALLLTGLALLLWIALRVVRRQTPSRLLQSAFIALITLDVMLPAVEWQPVAPRDIALPAAPEILKSAIAAGATGRLIGAEELLPPNMAMHFGFRDIRGYELPHNLRLVQLLERLNLNQLDSRGILPVNRLVPHITPEIEAYLDRTCVRCVMAWDHAAAKSVTSLTLEPDRQSVSTRSWPRFAADNNGTMLFTNPNAYPRVYLARAAVPAIDATQAMETLLDLRSDLRERSVFEGPGDPLLPSANQLETESATITTDLPEHVVIATQSPARRLLVLADRMDIGWQVEIDGHSADAVTADYLFRGVFLPPGNHTVEWTYIAPGLTAGISISLATLVLVLGTITATSLPKWGHS